MNKIEELIDSLKNHNTRIKFLLSKMYSGEITDDEYQQLQVLLIWQYTVQDILTYRRINSYSDEFYSGQYPICQTKLDDNKLLFISDTHIGYEGASLIFVSSAYDFALKNGIKTVIHAGDFVEGISRNYKEMKSLSYDERFEMLEKEVESAFRLLPKEIKTKLLFGNHDYSSLQSCPDLVLSFFNHDNLDVIGMGRALIDWGGIPIEISHKINDKMFDEELKSGVLQIKGHAHEYYIRGNNEVTLSLPTLSKDFRGLNRRLLDDYGLYCVNAGFVEAERVDLEKILFRRYLTFDKEPTKIKEEVEYDTRAKKFLIEKSKHY